MQSTKLSQDITKFIDDRVLRLSNDNIGGEKKPRVVMHIVPLSSYYNSSVVDIKLIYEENSPYFSALRPMNTEPVEGKLPHVEGKLYSDSIQTKTGGEYPSVTQLFRNASIEAYYYILRRDPDEKYISGKYFQDILNASLKKYMDFIVAQSIDGPALVFLNVINTKGYSLIPSNTSKKDQCPDAIDQDSIKLGYIEVKPNEIEDSLKPLFKILYDAFDAPFKEDPK